MKSLLYIDTTRVYNPEEQNLQLKCIVAENVILHREGIINGTRRHDLEPVTAAENGTGYSLDNALQTRDRH